MSFTYGDYFGFTEIEVTEQQSKQKKAITQIKEKEYVQKFIKENSNALAVAICYDFNNKEHSCKQDRRIKMIYFSKFKG